MQAPLHEKPIGYLVARLYWLGRRYFDAELKPLGFGHGSLPFLVTVWRQDGISQNELSFDLHTDKANTARAVRKLVDLGYVQRVRDPDDRRKKIVRLTPEGKNIMPDVKKALLSWNATITSSLDEEEYNIVHSLLSSMLVNAGDKPEQ